MAEIALDTTPACRGMETKLFFPDESAFKRNDELPEVVRKACQTCPIRLGCLSEGMSSKANMANGVWGGTLPKERFAIRRNKKYASTPEQWLRFTKRWTIWPLRGDNQ